MSRRALSAIISLILVLGTAGCNEAVPPNEPAEPTASEQEGGFVVSEEMQNGTAGISLTESEEEGGFDTSGIDTSEHVVITYLTTGDKPVGEAAERLRETIAELNETLNEKVNAELNIDFVEWDNYLENYNEKLALLDGSVDLVGASTDWLDGWINVKKGVFLPLSENMLKKYAPLTYESVTPEHWDMCKYNDDIYFMPEDNYTQWTNHGFIYRMDFAKELGLEDGITNWEELTRYLENVRSIHPELKEVWDADGTQYLNMAEGWIVSHSDYVPIQGLCSSNLWGGTLEDPYTLYVPAMQDTDMLIEYARLMKEWDARGVWPSDVMTNSSADNREEYRKGQVALEQHHTQTYVNLCSKTGENILYQDNPDASSGFFYFGQENGNLVAQIITHGAMAVSAASENPERALMVYDLLRNDPVCYRLICYGIEGVSYSINEQGLRDQPEGYNPEADNIYDITNFWWGRNDNNEIRDAKTNWDTVDELYTAYEKKKIDYPYGQFVPDETEIEGKIEKCNEIYNSYMKQISYGKYDGTAEDIVTKMQDELALEGIDDVTAVLQEQIDALYK
ncbi:DUF3502 domain-containing protein [Butyrivibrio sp. WCD2001]|uniref:DUF3502 domain-containing protein n=1 Tax=Butyrivibrio sp. WCD2001 TaxID=1280681 RepID=UPI0004139774|nr:DUF3502 domain-containing protein [Butyrivibrio sp. WCD2001]